MKTAELKLMVPTYYGTVFPDEVARGEIEEDDCPHIPVLVQQSGCIRVLLGTHDDNDFDKPDIHIERQPNGWTIILYPEGVSGEPSGYLFVLDGGKSYLMRDDATTIRVLKPGDERPYRMKLPLPPTVKPAIIDGSKNDATK